MLIRKFAQLEISIMKLMKRKLRVESGREFNLYHLCYYLSKNTRRDNDQELILDFKNNEEHAVRSLVIEAINNLEQLGIDEDTLIVRALSSHETKPDHLAQKSLHRLGLSLNCVFDCSYCAEVLYKKKSTDPLKHLSIAGRKAEMRDVYAVDKNLLDLHEFNVLLIDDVVTTGTTAGAIIDAILKAFPQTRIEVFSLAWTPTYRQQLALGLQEREAMYFSEPEFSYGVVNGGLKVDEDFESGETLVSMYPGPR